MGIGEFKPDWVSWASWLDRWRCRRGRHGWSFHHRSYEPKRGDCRACCYCGRWEWWNGDNWTTTKVGGDPKPELKKERSAARNRRNWHQFITGPGDRFPKPNVEWGDRPTDDELYGAMSEPLGGFLNRPFRDFPAGTRVVTNTMSNIVALYAPAEEKV